MLSAKSTKEAFRFVAYLDLLGMSALSLKDPECAIGVLVAFDEIVSQTSKMAVVKVKHKKPLSHPITWTFSDSVVIVTQGDSDADWWAIVSVTTTLFLMALSRVIPLRGAIAHGKFLITGQEGNIFGGPALVRTHDLGEDTGWLGVVVDDEVGSRYFDPEYKGIKEISGNNSVLVKWPVHTKSRGKQTLTCLNWPVFIENLESKRTVRAEDVYGNFSVLFGDYDKLSARAKSFYQATADFMNQKSFELAPASPSNSKT